MMTLAKRILVIFILLLPISKSFGENKVLENN